MTNVYDKHCSNNFPHFLQTFFGYSNDKSEYPKNVCKRCGKLLDYGDIDINNCNPDDRSYLRAIKIYCYWTDHFASDYDYNITQDGLDKAEEEMISKGLITSKQEENEYEKTYYERLENKYRNENGIE